MSNFPLEIIDDIIAQAVKAAMYSELSRFVLVAQRWQHYVNTVCFRRLTLNKDESKRGCYQELILLMTTNVWMQEEGIAHHVHALWFELDNSLRDSPLVNLHVVESLAFIFNLVFHGSGKSIKIVPKPEYHQSLAIFSPSNRNWVGMPAAIVQALHDLWTNTPLTSVYIADVNHVPINLIFTASLCWICVSNMGFDLLLDVICSLDNICQKGYILPNLTHLTLSNHNEIAAFCLATGYL